MHKTYKFFAINSLIRLIHKPIYKAYLSISLFIRPARFPFPYIPEEKRYIPIGMAFPTSTSRKGCNRPLVATT